MRTLPSVFLMLGASAFLVFLGGTTVRAFPSTTGSSSAPLMEAATSPPQKEAAAATSAPPLSSSSSSSLIAQQQQDLIFDAVRRDYLDELATGYSVFGTAEEVVGTTRTESHIVKDWSDADFVSHSVGVGHAGPSETAFPRGGERVFQTVAPVLSPEECEALVREAQQVIDEGLRSERAAAAASGGTADTTSNEEEEDRRRRPTNSQLGEARVSQLPIARQWLRQVLHKRFFPLLENRFGIPAADLTLQDALIIGYGYLGKKGSLSQPVHRDSSLLSLNVALSPQSNYEQGGTFFEGLPPDYSIISNEQGHVVCHPSGIPHAGRGIGAGGERWVLVLFVIAKNQPELARRCHARGMEERDNNSAEQLEQAKATFQAGLTAAPHDHLLLTSLGGVFMAQGQELSARGCLARAAYSYPHCTKAHMALGRMFLAMRRPRAALRRFDAVLDWMDDRDLAVADGAVWPPLRAVGFDARVFGSQAALVCARAAKEKGCADLAWRDHVKRAVARCEIALLASPNDERIRGMLAFAETLLLD